MTIADEQYRQYAAYLQSRSNLALLYRRWHLYPRISRHLHGRVLDIGSGVGDFVRYRRGTIGVDVNPVAVQWCRDRGLDVRLMMPDRLPFEAGAFDGVVLDNVLEHLVAPEMLLREVARVCTNGASLIVGVPGSCGFARDPDHKVFYDEERLVKTIARAGFHKRTILHAPLRSAWLESRVPQYCLYGVFRPV